jgi:hypothetical protein
MVEPVSAGGTAAKVEAGKKVLADKKLLNRQRKEIAACP